MRRLLGTADVIVESFRPGVMERLGLGYETLHSEFPRLIFLSVPAYPEGHRLAQRPGYDALVQASSGQMWEQPGWRMGPDLPAHADAEHGRVLPREPRHHRRADRA